MKRTYLFAGILLALMACGGNEEKAGNEEKQNVSDFYASNEDKELLISAKRFFQPLPDRAESETNPLTKEKINLGKVLYLDTRLSKDGNNSCNSCHKLESFGVDNLPTSLGDLGKNGDRNSPTTFNAALHTTQFWDGRAADVEEQAGMPIMNPVEMNIPDEAFLVERLKGIDEYKDMFAAAFPEDTDPISYSNLRMAIGAFERTLMTPGRFDDFLNGDEEALTSAEKNGLKLFIETGCVTCHTGPAMGGNMFQKFGVYGDYWEVTGSEHVDEGRFKETGNEGDKYMFKVPTLRNIEKTGPYFHDGSVAELNEVIRIMGKLQLNKDLSDEDVQSIEVFLNSLTGEVPSIASS